METKIKGYCLLASAKFIRGLGASVPAESLARVAAIESEATPTAFYPRPQACVLWGIVAAAGKTEEESYDLLVKCGKAISDYALTTYMRLLLKVLTPRMFARKFPDFWARDHQGGAIVVDTVEDHRLIILFKGVDDLDHIGAIAVGFIGTTFEAIGVPGLQVLRPNWSLAEASPETVRLELRWK
jgi:hypothetical protein